MALVAAAAPRRGSTAARRRRRRRRAGRVAKKSPARKVTAIVQFKPGFAERKAKTLVAAHGGKVTSRVPLINGLAVQLPAKQAAALAAERQVVGLTLNSRVHGTGDRGRRARRRASRRRSRPTSSGVAATRARASASPSSTPASPATPSTSRTRPATRASIANAVTRQGRHDRGRRLRPRHARRGHHRRQLAQPPRGRPASRQVHRRRAGREPDRGQGLRRGRQLDRPGRHQRHPVRRRPQGRVQHPRRSTCRSAPTRRSPTSSTRSTRPSSTRGRRGIVVVAASGNRGAAPDAVKYSPANDPFVISVGGVDEDGQLRPRQARRLVLAPAARRTASPSRT